MKNKKSKKKKENSGKNIDPEKLKKELQNAISDLRIGKVFKKLTDDLQRGNGAEMKISLESSPEEVESFFQSDSVLAELIKHLEEIDDEQMDK